LGARISIRSSGRVKLASLGRARVHATELLRFDPARYIKPAAPATAGHFRGIAVVSR
jgi:indolepyruvate ferredoxin oxidoreductase